MDWNTSLNISQSEAQGRVPITILHVDGRINMSNAEILEHAVRVAYEKGARYFLLDLRNVPSLTSVGLRSIHWMYNILNQGASRSGGEAESGTAAGGSSASPYVKVLCSSPQVLKVLNLAGFDLYIEVYGELQEAISAF